jgi:hypothetical protein
MGELAQASKRARPQTDRERRRSPGGPAPTEPLGPTINHHLKVLTDAGLIERDKGVVWAYNRAVPATLQMIADLIAPPVD